MVLITITTFYRSAIDPCRTFSACSRKQFVGQLSIVLTLIRFCATWTIILSGNALTGKKFTSTIQSICGELGVPLAHEKTVDPSTCLVFLGIELDSVEQIISLPPEKLSDIKQTISKWVSVVSCTVIEPQSLIGTLQFAAKCISAGRLFTRRLICMLKGQKAGHVLQFTPRIILDEEFKKDVSWWLQFLPRWNGIATFLDVSWSCSDTLSLFTDASASVGCGAFFDNQWFHFRWPE